MGPLRVHKIRLEISKLLETRAYVLCSAGALLYEHGIIYIANKVSCKEPHRTTLRTTPTRRRHYVACNERTGTPRLSLTLYLLPATRARAHPASTLV